MEHQRQSPVEGFGGILPRNMLKIEVLKNGISDILRLSQCGVRGSTEPPKPPLDLSQHIVLLTCTIICIIFIQLVIVISFVVTIFGGEI